MMIFNKLNYKSKLLRSNTPTPNDHYNIIISLSHFVSTCNAAKTEQGSDAGSMLGHRQSNIDPAYDACVVIAGNQLRIVPGDHVIKHR